MTECRSSEPRQETPGIRMEIQMQVEQGSVTSKGAWPRACHRWHEAAVTVMAVNRARQGHYHLTLIRPQFQSRSISRRKFVWEVRWRGVRRAPLTDDLES